MIKHSKISSGFQHKDACQNGRHFFEGNPDKSEQN